MSSAGSAICRGDGFQFDQLAFVGSQVRNEKAQNFARLFRQSQMYEVFINERLKLASQDYRTSDNFERKVLINSVDSFCSMNQLLRLLLQELFLQHVFT